MLKKLQNLRQATEEGFTLIELMIVVVIIGILAGISIPIMANQQKATLRTSVLTDIKGTNINLTTALIEEPSAVWISGQSCSTDERTQGTLYTRTPITVKFDIQKSFYETCINIAGTWDNYYIHGMNSKISDGVMGSYNAETREITGFGIVYTSVDGKVRTNED